MTNSKIWVWVGGESEARWMRLLCIPEYVSVLRFTEGSEHTARPWSIEVVVGSCLIAGGVFCNHGLISTMGSWLRLVSSGGHIGTGHAVVITNKSYFFLTYVGRGAGVLMLCMIVVVLP